MDVAHDPPTQDANRLTAVATLLHFLAPEIHAAGLVAVVDVEEHAIPTDTALAVEFILTVTTEKQTPAAVAVTGVPVSTFAVATDPDVAEETEAVRRVAVVAVSEVPNDQPTALTGFVAAVDTMVWLVAHEVAHAGRSTMADTNAQDVPATTAAAGRLAVTDTAVPDHDPWTDPPGFVAVTDTTA